MGATNPADQFRLDLENILAPVVRIDMHLRIAQMKLAQWARTDYEADILKEIIEARRELKKAHQLLLEFHPNSRIQSKKEVTISNNKSENDFSGNGQPPAAEATRGQRSNIVPRLRKMSK